jgi:hypothetical protein
MLARVIAYVGALASLAIAGIRLWDQLPEKTKTYRIFRHPKGECELEAAAVIGSKSGCLASQASPKTPFCVARFGRARLPRCWFSCNFLVYRRIM